MEEIKERDKIRIIFFGTDEFAKIVLEKAVESLDVVCVVTREDKKAGRGQQLVSPIVKNFAMKKGIKIIQTENLKAEEFENQIRELKPDLICAVSFGKLIPDNIIRIPKLGSINLHPSLLPLYKGPSPIRWVLLNGETQTGITVQYIADKFDEGDIILQEGIQITDEDNYGTLYEKLALKGGDILLKAIELIKSNKVIPIKQQRIENPMTSRKLKKEDFRIDWNKSAININNLIRAGAPNPGAYTYFRNSLLKIINSRVSNDVNKKASVGEIIGIERNIGVSVMTGDGVLVIKKVQPENKKVMDIQDFINGYKIKIGERLWNLQT